MALFAMLLQTLLPLWHHPANAAAPDGAHICSVFRFSAEHAEPGKAPIAKPACPICFSLHLFSGGFVPPAAGLIAVVLQERNQFIFHAENSPPHFDVWPGLRSRAPPFLA